MGKGLRRWLRPLPMGLLAALLSALVLLPTLLGVADWQAGRAEQRELELLRQHSAQPRITLGLTIAQRQLIELTRSEQLAQRRGQKRGPQPIGWEHPCTRLRLGAGRVKHAPDQRCGIELRAPLQRLLTQDSSPGVNALYSYTFSSCRGFSSMPCTHYFC